MSETVKIIVFSIFQSAFLAVAQLLLKMGFDRVTAHASATWSYLKLYVLNWHLWVAAFSYSIGMGLWFYMLKKFPLNVVYPLTSISYIFTAVLGIAFLHEQMNVYSWLGIGLIMAGVAFIAQ